MSVCDIWDHGMAVYLLIFSSYKDIPRAFIMWYHLTLRRCYTNWSDQLCKKVFSITVCIIYQFDLKDTQISHRSSHHCTGLNGYQTIIVSKNMEPAATYCHLSLEYAHQLAYFSKGTLELFLQVLSFYGPEVWDKRFIFETLKIYIFWYTYIVIRSFEEKLKNVKAIPVSPDMPPAEVKYWRIVRSRKNMR